MAFKMKGSPFQRNFGIGSPLKKETNYLDDKRNPPKDNTNKNTSTQNDIAYGGTKTWQQGQDDSGGNLNTWVKERSNYEKGSNEYNILQNKINEALGSDVRYEVKGAHGFGDVKSFEDVKTEGGTHDDNENRKETTVIETPKSRITTQETNRSDLLSDKTVVEERDKQTNKLLNRYKEKDPNVLEGAKRKEVSKKDGKKTKVKYDKEGNVKKTKVTIKDPKTGKVYKAKTKRDKEGNQVTKVKSRRRGSIFWEKQPK